MDVGGGMLPFLSQLFLFLAVSLLLVHMTQDPTSIISLHSFLIHFTLTFLLLTVNNGRQSRLCSLQLFFSFISN